MRPLIVAEPMLRAPRPEIVSESTLTFCPLAAAARKIVMVISNLFILVSLPLTRSAARTDLSRGRGCDTDLSMGRGCREAAGEGRRRLLRLLRRRLLFLLLLRFRLHVRRIRRCAGWRLAAGPRLDEPRFGQRHVH